MKLRPFLLSLALSVLGWLAPESLHAQFIGYVGLQSASQNLFSSTACTGAAQTAVVANQGQTQHSLLIQSSSAQSQVFLQGSTDGVNFTRISDEMDGFTSGTTLTASGYYPVVRVNMTCTAGGTFSIQYSGTQVQSAPPAGDALRDTVDKGIVSGASSTVNANYSIRPPYGNIQGLLILSGGNATTGPQLTWFCNRNTAGGPYVIYTVQAATTAVATGPQYFPIPNIVCPNLSLNYSAGTGGTTYSLEYVFSPPGTQSDPCGTLPQSLGLTTSFSVSGSVLINAAAAATTAIVANQSASTIYVCGFTLSQGAAGTFQFIAGTGATCGTGTTNLTGAIPMAANTPISYGGSGKTIFRTTEGGMAGGQRLCITTTGAGATAIGVLTYVQF